MTALPTVYALLRDGLEWDARLTHLEVQPDGSLALRRLPGLAGGAALDLPGPYAVQAAGLALDDCQDVYLSDPAAGQVVRLDGVCNSLLVLPALDGPVGAPGQFDQPRGLLLTKRDLLVADAGNGRIQVLRLPSLEARAVWTAGLQTPVALAHAPSGGVYVLDAGLEVVLRLTSGGLPDGAFPPVPAVGAFAIAAAPDGRLFVSLPGNGRVDQFESAGAAQGSLPAGGPAQPGALALAAAEQVLYAADRADGRIWAFDLAGGSWIGPLAGYCAPAAALAAGAGGALLVLTGQGRQVITLAAGAATAPSGWLEAGPLDAGDVSTWVRVSHQADLTAGGAVSLRYYSAPAALPGPSDLDWIDAPAGDLLLQSPAAMLDHPELRYLWLRVELRPSPTGAPRLLQVAAQTAGEDWMDFLPAVYRRIDAGQGDFLRRWLALLQGELGDLENVHAQLARRFDPSAAPPEELSWLASWLGCTLPPGLPVEEQRRLLARLMQVYHRRGTRLGVAEWVELFCGVRPLIVEDYRERRLWILGQESLLGFDSGLAPALPEGMVVPDSASSPGCAPAASPDGQGEAAAAGIAEEPAAWSEPAGLVVGSVLVGQAVPLPAERWGEPLFTETAHRFTVLVPGVYMPDLAARRWLAAVIDAEKPAHTDYRLCFIEAEMRVGFQARIGIDTILAGPPQPAALGAGALSVSARLSGEPPSPGRELSPARAGAARIGSGFILE